MSSSCAISGPISSADPDQEARNLRAFRDAANVLRLEREAIPGWGSVSRWERVFSPLEVPGTEDAAAESSAMLVAGEDYTTGPLYRRLLRECFRQILDSRTLFVLPRWTTSTGATREVRLAEWAGIEILDFQTRERLALLD